MTDDEIFQSEEYKAYHKEVVDNCVEIMSERARKFFDGCDYLEAFKNKVDAWDEAQENVDALD